MTFMAYMENIEKVTGKSREQIWKIANKNGFVKRGKVVATHAQMLEWLKGDMKLGHVRANFVILYLRLRTNDPKVSQRMRTWAYDTGYEK
ncbi:MAG TPA: DUF4287 domain-containing protein [Candidatus Aquilonibacter sp.]|nr:DUF4287 domain-containing protein [Candidatus Aquilonibacter sp.]